NAMMDFCEELIRAVVFKVLGQTLVQYGEHSLDFAAPFRRVGMKESLAGSVDLDQVTNENLVSLFEEHVEPHLIQPTFITNFPKPISPLSKGSPADPNVAE